MKLWKQTVWMIAGLAAIVLGSQSAPAYATSEGGASTGGGDAVRRADGSWTLLDLMEDSKLDLFIPNQSGGMLYVDLALSDLLKGKCSSFAIYALSKVLNQAMYRWKVVDRTGLPLRELIWIFTERDLEDIKDEGVIRLDTPVEGKQVAIQKDGVVVINKPIFEKMDSKSRGALILHEAALRVALLTNPEEIQKNGTSQLRLFVGLAFRKDLFMLPETLFAPLCGDNSLLTGEYAFRRE